MSVVSAPTRAGRSPYHSEPSIEAPNPTTSAGGATKTGRYAGDSGLSARVQPDRVAGPTAARRTHTASLGTRRRPLNLTQAPFPTPGGPTPLTAVRAAYPSPRANPASSLDYVRAKSLQIATIRGCAGHLGRRPNPK